MDSRLNDNSVCSFEGSIDRALRPFSSGEATPFQALIRPFLTAEWGNLSAIVHICPHHVHIGHENSTGFICPAIKIWEYLRTFSNLSHITSCPDMSGYVRIPDYEISVICIDFAGFKGNFQPDCVLGSRRVISGNVRKGSVS